MASLLTTERARAASIPVSLSLASVWAVVVTVVSEKADIVRSPDAITDPPSMITLASESTLAIDAAKPGIVAKESSRSPARIPVTDPLIVDVAERLILSALMVAPVKLISALESSVRKSSISWAMETSGEDSSEINSSRTSRRSTSSRFSEASAVKVISPVVVMSAEESTVIDSASTVRLADPRFIMPLMVSESSPSPKSMVRFVRPERVIVCSSMVFKEAGESSSTSVPATAPGERTK